MTARDADRLKPDGPSTALLGDVVMTLSLETWDDVVRRQFCRPPDQLAQHLLASPRVNRVLIANPWRSQLSRLRGPGSDFPTSDTASLWQPRRLAREDPRSLRALRRSYERYDAALGVAARSTGIQLAHLITFNPFVAAYGAHEWCRSVTYYARDDWAAYPARRDWWPRYRDAYAQIRLRRVKVCAVSHVLLDRLEPDGPGAIVPNGISSETWSARPENRAAAGAAPLVVYTGTIDDRVSIRDLQSVRRALPAARLMLVGPLRRELPELRQALGDGLETPGSVDQARLAELVRSADVCVIPHVDNDLTRAMSPLKLYEYLAAGRRVVATDLPPQRGVHPSVRLVPSGADFGAAVAVALQDPPMSETQRQRFIAENNWSARGEAVLDLMGNEP